VAGELANLGLSREAVLDFSVNLNPYGPHRLMVEAVTQARIDVYPDSTARLARERLAGSLCVAPERIVIGNGAADLLWTAARVLVAPGETAMMVEPTFSEFRAAASVAHARVTEWRARPEDDFAVDVPAVAAAARAGNAAAVYLCTPNNPTGATVSAADIIQLAELLPQATLVVDQSFVSLSEAHADAFVDVPDNVVRVRSLTKEHAIPGVRVGYLVASAALAAAIERSRAAWTAGAAAQAAAWTSVDLEAFVGESRERMLADRRRLVERIRARGLLPSPTTASFCVVRVGPAAPLRSRLLARHGILVRDCTSFGLPEHIRIGARPADDGERLVAALAEELR